MDIIFTLHARDRMRKRKITEDEVFQAIKTPDKTIKMGEKYHVQKNIGRASIEIIYEKDRYIKIITLYYI